MKIFHFILKNYFEATFEIIQRIKKKPLKIVDMCFEQEKRPEKKLDLAWSRDLERKAKD